MRPLGYQLRTPERGFTLIELLVALALAAALTAVALPRLLPSPELQARTTARSIATNLRKTRNVAVTEHRTAELGVDLDGGTVAGAGKRRALRLPANLEYTLTTAAELNADGRDGERSGAIRFYPDGSSSGGRISVAAAGRRFHVDVDWFTGRIRILTESVDG